MDATDLSAIYVDKATTTSNCVIETTYTNETIITCKIELHRACLIDANTTIANNEKYEECFMRSRDDDTSISSNQINCITIPSIVESMQKDVQPS